MINKFEDGIKVGCFRSMKDAGDDISVSKQAISEAIKEGRSCKGFIYTRDRKVTEREESYRKIRKMITDNILKPVNGIDYYYVSKDGKVYSVRTPKLKELKGRDCNGYRTVTLTDADGVHQLYIHRLVAKAWLPHWSDNMEVNHKDMDKTNNSVDNLEWVTHMENVRHARANKTWGRRKAV